MSQDVKSVAIVGTGLVGRSWAVLFAVNGFNTRLYDVNPHAADAALLDIRDMLSDMNVDSESVLARIEATKSFDAALDGVAYVQECAPETVEIKRLVFTQLQTLAAAETILASSCSGIPPDLFMLEGPSPERAIIAHPFSSPHSIPLVEVVPSTRTALKTIKTVYDFLESLGREPILVRKPVHGFGINRIQAAVIAEAISLVRNGVLTPDDADKCLRSGLARRWAFIGPFETMDLNSANGFVEYVRKFGEDYHTTLADMDTQAPWEDATLSKIETEMRRRRPDAEAITLRRRWRDKALAELDDLIDRLA
ncbi:MAG: 3-hydroxyacyl-CoA dehydrogenase NAD-binding domain-containing protein [Pseudomonadota bacterium]